MKPSLFAIWIVVLALGCGTDPAGHDAGVASDSGGQPDGTAMSSDAGVGLDATKGADVGFADASVRDFVCTHVIGFSQTNQWYTAGPGVFESLVEDDQWQLRWNGGAGVDMWRDENYAGWDNAVVSPCRAQTDDPDRVVLTISGPYAEDENAWSDAIRETISVIRTKHPSVREIVLQPVVGGPGHAECPTRGGGRIRASWQHAHIDNAIMRVVGPDVVAGVSPEVSSCDEYRDSLGHLTDPGAESVGGRIGAFYAAF